jgi:hypothetical protein
VNNREKFEKWLKELHQDESLNFKIDGTIYDDWVIHAYWEAWEASRNAALAEVMALCAKEWHAQIELDTARNAKNALMHSPDSAKWQKMMTLIRGIK